MAAFGSNKFTTGNTYRKSLTMRIVKLVLAAAMATSIAPAQAKDRSFTLVVEYDGNTYETTSLSEAECARLLIAPTAKIRTRDKVKMIVPAAETKRSCTTAGRNSGVILIAMTAGPFSPMVVLALAASATKGR